MKRLHWRKSFSHDGLSGSILFDTNDFPHVSFALDFYPLDKFVAFHIQLLGLWLSFDLMEKDDGEEYQSHYIAEYIGKPTQAVKDVAQNLTHDLGEEGSYVDDLHQIMIQRVFGHPQNSAGAIVNVYQNLKLVATVKVNPLWKGKNE